VPTAIPVAVSRSVAGLGDRARDPEVGDHAWPYLEQDVFGLHVAMDDAAAVRRSSASATSRVMRSASSSGSVPSRFSRDAAIRPRPNA